MRAKAQKGLRKARVSRRGALLTDSRDYALLLCAAVGVSGCTRALELCPRLDDGAIALYLFDEDGGSELRARGSAEAPGGQLRSPGVERATSPCGGALYFPATGPLGADDEPAPDHALVPAHPLWELASGSIDVWLRFKPLTAKGSYGIISRDSRGPGAGHLTAYRVHGDSGDTIAVRLQGLDGSNGTGDTASTCVSTPVATEAWHHLGVNFGGGSAPEVYLDGQRARPADEQPLPSTSISCATEARETGGIDGNREPWVLGASSEHSQPGAADPSLGGMGGWLAALRISRVRRDFSEAFPAPSGPCGDGTCAADERCDSCPRDCGSCGARIVAWKREPAPAEPARANLISRATSDPALCSPTSTPLATYRSAQGESVYLAYAAKGKLLVARRSPGGEVTEAQLGDRLEPDAASLPSLGIDRAGHVHVVWNVALDPWSYVVSERPDDLGALVALGGSVSRDQPRGLPGGDRAQWDRGVLQDGKRSGESIADPAFITLPDGELLLTFIHRVEFTSSDPGDLARGLARYDVSTRRWRMLGGARYDHGTTTLIWDRKGRFDGQRTVAGQSYSADFTPDRRGALHLSWSVEDGGTDEDRRAPWLLYARSEDGGESWRKADGKAIESLPLSSENADVIAFGRDGDGSRRWVLPKVTALPDGTPVVSARDVIDGRTVSFLHNGVSWQRRDWEADLGDAPRAGTDLYASGNGWLSWVSTNTIDAWRRSPDLFASSTLLASFHGNRPCVRPDKRYLLLTNRLRYSVWANLPPARVEVYSEVPSDESSVWSAPLAAQPERLLLDREDAGPARATAEALTWDQDWTWRAGKLYLYSSLGDPAKRWSRPGIETE